MSLTTGIAAVDSLAEAGERFCWFAAQGFDDHRKNRYRGNIVYEYLPWSFTQLRLGVRARDSDDDTAALNSDEAFLQLHVFF